MKDIDIIEENKKIALFLGLSICPTDPTKFGQSGCLIDGGWVKLQFDRDWTAIMIAVAKIESINDDSYGLFGVYIHNNSCHILATKLHVAQNLRPAYFSEHHADTKIRAIWMAIISFIDWYNNVPPPQKKVK